LLIEDASAASFTPYDEQATAVALDRQELRGVVFVAAWKWVQVLKLK
jgi:hypothetical protein